MINNDHTTNGSRVPMPSPLSQSAHKRVCANASRLGFSTYARKKGKLLEFEKKNGKMKSTEAPYEARTRDPEIKSLVLYQLS
jgi:hypothetical protein